MRFGTIAARSARGTVLIIHEYLWDGYARRIARAHGDRLPSRSPVVLWRDRRIGGHAESIGTRTIEA
jgi:hypothetical protein